MVFSHPFFVYFFLPAILLCFYLPRSSAVRRGVLTAFSLLFYAWGEPIYVFLMIAMVGLDYIFGLLIVSERSPKMKKLWLALAVMASLTVLGIFKYTGFLASTTNGIFGTSIPVPNIVMPIGISFFTFQSMSYTIDLYRRNIKVQKNPVSFIGFVSLFPQLVAGPIVRYENIQNEIDNRTITEKMIGDGISRFIIGLGKKVLIANNIGMLWTAIKTSAEFDYTNLSVVTAWLGILAFTFQIYFDFSGYSDMAIGLGKMMGFNFPENFDYPYMSHSVSEFWRRWHMTLGAWFKSYIYIPLGGNRKGTGRTIFNLLVVWTVTGIWHGASWNFMLWGAYFGVLIVLERLFLGKWLEKIPSFFSWLYTFILVVFGWVLFDAIDPANVDIVAMFGQVFTYIGAMFGANGILMDNEATKAIMDYGIMFALCILGSSDVIKTACGKIKEKAPSWVMYGAPVVQMGIMLAAIAYLSTASYNPFLYFNF